MLLLCGILSLMWFVPLHPWPPSKNSLKPTCTPKHIHPSLNHPPGVLRGVRPLLCPWTQNFVDCFLFCCALESSCLGRLSAIKVQLELELGKCVYCKATALGATPNAILVVVFSITVKCLPSFPESAHVLSDNSNEYLNNCYQFRRLLVIKLLFVIIFLRSWHPFFHVLSIQLLYQNLKWDRGSLQNESVKGFLFNLLQYSCYAWQMNWCYSLPKAKPPNALIFPKVSKFQLSQISLTKAFNSLSIRKKIASLQIFS